MQFDKSAPSWFPFLVYATQEKRQLRVNRHQARNTYSGYVERE
jgi:hypothetical protein